MGICASFGRTQEDYERQKINVFQRPLSDETDLKLCCNCINREKDNASPTNLPLLTQRFRKICAQEDIAPSTSPHKIYGDKPSSSCKSC